MGKKSREKRERKAARTSIDQSSLLRDVSASRQQGTRDAKFEDEFQRRVEQTRLVLQHYMRRDAAIALGVSDLWPANVASCVKHIFTWVVLLGIDENTPDALPISTYGEFRAFATALYEAWPDLRMLEDFSPEADWGQTKARLDSEFVPMFYGGCIERTPDFVEAFRITYADADAALADMDLVVAVQACIIEAIPDLSDAPLPQPNNGYVEVPPESFWLACRSALLKVGHDLAERRSNAGKGLEVGFGTFKGPLTRNGFADAVMQGLALPFLAVTEGNDWIPVSIRSQPGVVIDYWARRHVGGTGEQTHRALARFVAERFRQTYVGPMTLMVGNSTINHLPVSCVIADRSGLYLICACDLASYKKVSLTSRDVYSALRSGQLAHFRLSDGRGLCLGRGEAQGPNAEELRILIVVTQSSTAFGAINTPERPARLIPLADFVTIFDKLDELRELERFWKYVDGQRGALSPFSSGLADLFASFDDSHGVLVDGAMTPTMIMLDPHWGTRWRFQDLCSFWSCAPRRFPDGSSGWSVRHGTEGVTRLESRHQPVFGYSTQVGSCTIQTLVAITPGLQISDGRMLELFAELLADSLYRSRDVLSRMPLIQQPHVVLDCEVDLENMIAPEQPPESLEAFPMVVLAASRSSRQPNRLFVKISGRAVLAGLNGPKDASFEIRCLIETLRCCHDACGMCFPSELIAPLHARASEPARYHLQVLDRLVDVPDYVDPVIPSPTDYKLARKHLAIAMQQLGLKPGRYELAEAKVKIDAGRDCLRRHIERRLASLDRRQLTRQCVEQHDALLVAERLKIQRVRQSLSHAVEYDRLEAVEEARKEFGPTARHYRYLLEKVLSSAGTGVEPVTDDVLRELVGLADWYMVLAGAGDVLHNGVDVGGVEIDDSFISEVFYSTDSGAREAEFARQYAKTRLGVGLNEQDAVIGASAELLADEAVRQAFRQDLGFELQQLLSAMGILSQANRWGFGEELALSYAATPDRISQVLIESIEGLLATEATAIVEFLTLSGSGIRRLAGRDVDEVEVPHWEHTKRVHRYAIRPLVMDGAELRWGAEQASRAMNVWFASVRDGYLPADFAWPNVVPVIRSIKEQIEKRLEVRTGEIFLRHTPYVVRNVDFFRRFRGEGFEDVGDFDVLAFWPETDALVAVECKYNQPPYSVKDSRRLRDRIFGKAEDDRDGQFSRVRRRRQFLAQHRQRILELLKWPSPSGPEPHSVEVYVSREVYYWMVHPPYDIPTVFVRVDALDAWIKEHLVELAKTDDPAADSN